MAGKMKLSRRGFLLTGAAVGGGLLVGWGLWPKRGPAELAALLPTAEGEVALNAWLKIARDGTVTVAVPRQEMGQGIYTALPMLVAEELDADWDRVRVEQAPIDKVYVNETILMVLLPFGPDETGMVVDTARWAIRKGVRALGVQATGGSTSIRDAWGPMRLAGAGARDMLVGAAAAEWGVSAADCTTEAGWAIHAASGRKAAYGDLAEAAARRAPPAEPKLKDPSQFKLLGRPTARLDIPAKVDGSAEFGIDIRLPNMLYAAVKASPVFGGTVTSYDAAAVKHHPGVAAVVEVSGAVAVVADSTWRAETALAALPVAFDGGGMEAASSETIEVRFRAALEEEGRAYRDEGEAVDILENFGRPVVAADYAVPYLAHACMEPMNCTALVGGGKCEVWAPSQAPTLVKWVASSVADVDGDDVTVHTPYLGGGFGRRAEMDVVAQAVAIAKQLPGRPVKLTWSREEDIRHDAYRPAALSRFRAVLGGDGLPLAWWNRIASQSVTASYIGRHAPFAGGGPDKTTAEGAADLAYEIANQRVEHVAVETHVPVGYWRSVGHSLNAFFTESFLDELAHAAGRDPFDYRRALLQRHPHHAKVLATAAAKAGWDSPIGPGRGRGIALHESFGSIVAQVAEVTVTGGEVKVDRVVCAVDCGVVVNPDTVVAQMESGIVYGLTAALYGEITLAEGRVEQSNFPDYEMLRLAEMPVIETHPVPSGAFVGGVGEPGTPPIAPAVANAIFAATGKRLRALPLRLNGTTLSLRA